MDTVPGPGGCTVRRAGAAAGTALLLHGSGSTAEFARRALGPSLAGQGWRVLALEDRTGDVDAVARGLDDALDRLGRLDQAQGPELLVAGISLGAHAAVRWAARRERNAPLTGLLLALPAWTGEPAAVAALSAAAADDVEREGLAAVLARLGSQGWVGEELARAWPAYGQEQLVRALRATSCSPGPTEAELASVRVPVGLVAVADDPFHPVDVARRWQQLLPSAALEVLPAGAAAQDVAVLGRAGLAALDRAVPHQACGSSGSR